MLSCRRVKTGLFENADVTASIYDVPEHAYRSLGITQGHFDCLLSFVKVRTEEFECSGVFVWRGNIFENAPRVDADIFYTDKKDAFSKISGYVWTSTDLWGSRKGILIVCFLLSKFEQRSLNAAASSCGGGYFRKRSSCGRGYFLYG